MTAGVDVPTTGFEYVIPGILTDGEAAQPCELAAVNLRRYFDEYLLLKYGATRADELVLTESGFAAKESVAVIPYAIVHDST